MAKLTAPESTRDPRTRRQPMAKNIFRRRRLVRRVPAFGATALSVLRNASRRRDRLGRSHLGKTPLEWLSRLCGIQIVAAAEMGVWGRPMTSAKDTERKSGSRRTNDRAAWLSGQDFFHKRSRERNP
jgi:hypothetical protein